MVPSSSFSHGESRVTRNRRGRSPRRGRPIGTGPFCSSRQWFTMRILITGGAGFIGSHLAEADLGRGDEVLVLVLDDLSTGSPPGTRHFQGQSADR